MLYDQAQLAVAYSYAYQATKDEKFSAIVEDIMTYVKRDLGHPLGAFYSAEDADSKADMSWHLIHSTGWLIKHSAHPLNILFYYA